MVPLKICIFAFHQFVSYFCIQYYRLAFYSSVLIGLDTGLQHTLNNISLASLVTTITNQNLIQEEIKRRLNSGNTCYHSVQYLLSCLLSKNINIIKYKTIILPVNSVWVRNFVSDNKGAT
jgi:hypothetical protein